MLSISFHFPWTFWKKKTRPKSRYSKPSKLQTYIRRRHHESITSLESDVKAASNSSWTKRSHNLRSWTSWTFWTRKHTLTWSYLGGSSVQWRGFCISPCAPGCMYYSSCRSWWIELPWLRKRLGFPSTSYIVQNCSVVPFFFGPIHIFFWLNCRFISLAVWKLYMWLLNRVLCPHVLFFLRSASENQVGKWLPYKKEHVVILPTCGGTCKSTINVPFLMGKSTINGHFQ